MVLDSVRTRSCDTPLGPSIAVYCGEENHLAGEVILVDGEFFACPWTERRGSSCGMATLLEDPRVPVADEVEGVLLVVCLWLECVLRDREYAYWRLHYRDEDGLERGEEDPPQRREDSDGWKRVRTSLQKPELDLSRVRRKKKQLVAA